MTEIEYNIANCIADLPKYSKNRVNVFKLSSISFSKLTGRWCTTPIILNCPNKKKEKIHLCNIMKTSRTVHKRFIKLEDCLFVKSFTGAHLD